MSKDIFEDLEKSIEDAFKPEEKKKVDRQIDYWKLDRYYHTHANPDGTHSHGYSTHNHQWNHDYMRNNVYDELMFGPDRYRVVSDSIRCDL